MAKKNTKYECLACGYASLKWLGRCPSCKAFAQFAETRVHEAIDQQASLAAVFSQHDAMPLHGDVEDTLEGPERWSTGLLELDRVLGGGIVPGALMLLGGDPGIGKSTILLQLAGAMGQKDFPVLYVSGEESRAQVALRAKRLGVQNPHLWLLAEMNLQPLEQAFATLTPKVLLIDSMQTMLAPGCEGAAGSVTQLRAVTHTLLAWAKGKGMAIWMVGHVTKEGTIAGPKMVEHMVDTVLYFEAESSGMHRLVRAHKNRFGPAQEMAVFTMTSKGLLPVSNPSALFLTQRAEGPGALVITSMEGTRPFLLEVQALVLPLLYGGSPRRTTTGFEPQRVAVLAAVLQARAGIDLSGYDVFVNVAGGLKVHEPAADVGVALALASAVKHHPIDSHWVVMGELGLGGEIRAVSHVQARLQEAAALGFTQALIPKSHVQDVQVPEGMIVIGVATLQEALHCCGFELKPRAGVKHQPKEKAGHPS